MWTIFGILLILIALAMLMIKSFGNLRTEDVTVQNQFGGKRYLRHILRF